MSQSDSDEQIDQIEQFRNANIKPGMFVSGWEDPNDTVDEEKYPHETPAKEILWAVNEGKMDVVLDILNNHPDCVNVRDDEGYSPLHRACYNGNIELATILLKYGANVNAQTEYLWTPLHSACKWSQENCVALLLQHGANVNALTEGLQTPLHIAATVSNCRNVVTALMMHPNIKSDIKNNSNETAADIARRSGRTFPIFEMGNSAYRVETGLI